MSELQPEGHTVDAVDWLPSGARSGLVRVRGHRPPAIAGPLPELILETAGESKRFVSLPDPRADRDPTAWRGAYVLDARPAAEADRLWLEWPGGRRLPLPALVVPEHQVTRADEEPEPEPGDGHVVDRAVLAERRARRAEASEQAQARIAREALRAVEVLELRSAELEQLLAAAHGEREALRGQAAVSTEAPDARVEVLQAEIRELQGRLADQPVAPIPAVDGDRRAERLRAALTATVATVAELRLRLHESDVARRTRDVARAADAVRLAVLDRERDALTAGLEEAREGLREARRARDEAKAELEGARAAHEDVQTRHRETTAELGAARERMATLEAEVAALAVEAERAGSSAADAARAEEQVADLERRLARAESAIAGAETARELAEASALAAAAERRAAEVAHAAGHVPRAVPAPEPEPEPEREQLPALELAAAAAEQTRRAEVERAPAERVVADLDAARDALRKRVTIVTDTADPPGDVARGRGGREYPPLRGALVKLAHDDPEAAGRILAGLLKAQHAVLDAPPDYDLTIDEVGTFAVSAAGLTTLVSPLDEPRGRPHATFHIHADALTLAETVAGVERKAKRRRGPLRASGKVRQARQLTEGLKDVTLGELVRAGADVDPLLILRGFAYAVRPAWTQGQVWAVELLVEDQPLTIAARHSGGLTVSDGAHDDVPDATLTLSMEAFRDLVAGDEPTFVTDGDEAVVRRLLSLADRARAGDE